MKSTFKVLFYLKRNKETKSGEVMIMARITIDGNMCQFSTKQKINPKNWSVKLGKATGRTAEMVEINNLLDEIKASLYKVYHEMMRVDNYVTAEKIKNKFLGKNEDCATLIEMFNKHNEDVKALVGISKSQATYQKYEVTKRHLSEFLQYKYKLKDIAVREITPMFITDFEVYLMTACKCSTNTTAKFMQFFKRIIIIARDNGYMKSDPFSNYKIRIKQVDRGYLTEAEIAIISQKEFVSERLEQVRDVFIFSCFTGLSYIDVKNLTKEHLRTSFDGKLWIMTKRQKTDTSVNVPVLSIPKMILDKYKDTMTNGKLLPVISNQKLNSYLKEIADVCGIQKNLTFHSLRHSKAMHLLHAGVNLVYIRDILGHVSVQTTEIYAKADSKLKREALEQSYISVNPLTSSSPIWEDDKDLKDWLINLGK